MEVLRATEVLRHNCDESAHLHNRRREAHGVQCRGKQDDSQDARLVRREHGLLFWREAGQLVGGGVRSEVGKRNGRGASPNEKK